MKRIFAVLICLLLIVSVVLVFANRHYIPQKIDSTKELSELLGVTISSDRIVDEYFKAYTDNGDPYTDILYKTDYSFSEFDKIVKNTGGTHWGGNIAGVLRFVNELLPKNKAILQDSIKKIGVIYTEFKYDYLPYISSFSTQCNTNILYVNENDSEFVYINISLPRAFKSEMITENDESSEKETETNESDIPLSDAYSSVIEDFRTLTEYRFSDDFGTDSENTAYEAAYGILEKYKPDKSELDIDYHLHCMLVELPYYSAESASDYGYVIEDVNNDGVDELFWTNARKDFIYAIFTVNDEKPVMLDAFWSRYRCNVKDGEFITNGSGGAAVSEHSVRTIDFSKPGYLKTVAVFGTVNGEFYSKTDGIETAITEAEYSSLSEKYPFDFNQTGLTGDLLLLEGDTDSPPSDNTENSFSRKEILSETEEEKLSIAYPYMIGSDEALNEFVNGEIKRTIDNYKARWLQGEMYDELGFLTLEADYEITLSDQNNLSIVFKGTGNRAKAAHPSNTIFTLNLDLSNKQRLKLSDVTDMDSALIDNVCDRINNISTPEIKNYLQTLDMNNILQNCDHDGLEVSAYSYMKDDSLVLVLFTIHALGDYAEIPIE